MAAGRCLRLPNRAGDVRQSPCGFRGLPADPPAKRVRRETIVGWLFVLPALLMYAVFVLLPLLLTIVYSFYRWNGVGPMTWVGLKNYLTVFQVPDLLGTIFNAFWLVVWFSFIPVGLGSRRGERDPPRGDRAAGGHSPHRSVPAPGHTARRCRHHLGLVAGSPGLDQPDPEGRRPGRFHPCLARRLQLGAPSRRHDRDLGAAGFLHRPAARPA